MKFLSIFLVLSLVQICAPVAAQQADTVYTNGKIYTVKQQQPWAEAIAIKDGEFIKVGSADDVKAHIGDDTAVVDLGGKFVMPGFIDAHTHALNGADDMANLHIQQPGDKDAILAEIKAYSDANPDIEVIRGSAWNLGVFPNDSPRKELLDEIVLDKPVFLYSQSGHSAWLNSKGLEVAGITKDTPVTATFIYSKDPDTGEPTGRIDEYAMGHVEKIFPKTSPGTDAAGNQEDSKDAQLLRCDHGKARRRPNELGAWEPRYWNNKAG